MHEQPDRHPRQEELGAIYFPVSSEAPIISCLAQCSAEGENNTGKATETYARQDGHIAVKMVGRKNAVEGKEKEELLKNRHYHGDCID